MLIKNTSKEYIQRTNVVINFILKHFTEDLTLKKLAGIANYSPFHFQKIFKQVTGQTPKQFIIRMRLENSAHFLIAHSNKSITEIALDSGFASPSTFARAFKTYFGISADELRNLSPKEKIKFRQLVNAKKNGDVKLFPNEYDRKYWTKNLKVTINKVAPVHAVFVNAPMSDLNKIQDGFRKIIQFAKVYDLLTKDSKFIGIINPHAGLYQAAVTIQSPQSLPKDLNITEIESGKFASFKIKGDSLQTFNSLHAFHELWLLKSGYRIKQSYVFEILSQNPLTKSYSNIARELYIPIEPS